MADISGHEPQLPAPHLKGELTPSLSGQKERVQIGGLIRDLKNKDLPEEQKFEKLREVLNTVSWGNVSKYLRDKEERGIFVDALRGFSLTDLSPQRETQAVQFAARMLKDVAVSPATEEEIRQAAVDSLNTISDSWARVSVEDRDIVGQAKMGFLREDLDKLLREATNRA